MTIDVNTRELAKSCIISRSFRTGKFTLSNGSKSDYYIDLKPTMMDSIGLNSIAKLIASRINMLGTDNMVDYVSGLELGAVPLVSAVVALGNGFPHGLIVRKTAKDHGTQNAIEGLIPTETLANKNVVILEDVTTSGRSSMQALEAIQSQGGNVVMVLSVVDRNQGARKFFYENNVEFDCLFTIDEFLVDPNRNNKKPGWTWMTNLLKFKR